MTLGLYLPGVSGLLNGIEASLRTVIVEIEGRSQDGDLGSYMSNNSLLRSAEHYGMKVDLLAFPDEAGFRDNLKTAKQPVKIVQLRNDICHGNFRRFDKVSDDIRFFTPACLGETAAQLLQISFNWTRFLSDFFHQKGWRSSGSEGLILPDNPLKSWLTS